MERLLRAVYRPHNVYCVHVDRKSDDAFHTSIRLMISCLPNVVLADKSFGVEWGTSTVLLPVQERVALSHPYITISMLLRSVAKYYT